MDLNQKIIVIRCWPFSHHAAAGPPTPLRLALKLLMNTALGFAALWASTPPPLTGITLGLNAFNALVIGILGLLRASSCCCWRSGCCRTT